jgi:hypothetical protein
MADDVSVTSREGARSEAEATKALPDEWLSHERVAQARAATHALANAAAILLTNWHFVRDHLPPGDQDVAKDIEVAAERLIDQLADLRAALDLGPASK